MDLMLQLIQSHQMNVSSKRQSLAFPEQSRNRT